MAEEIAKQIAEEIAKDIAKALTLLVAASAPAPRRVRFCCAKSG
jgi:hypothetical protein